MLLPRERIPERTCEQVVDVHVRQVVEQGLEVPEISSQDREVHGTVEQILDVPVPEKVEQLVEVPETVSRDGVQQRTVEQIVDAPVMQAVEELAEVSKVFSQDRIHQRIVEQTIPAIPLAEKIVELPVIQTEEKTRQGVNTHAQYVVDTVEVKRPKIIDETVQKPIIQEKINPMTKHVEVPLSQFTGKAMDIPVVAQRQISTETVQKAIETQHLQCIDDVIDVPVVLVTQVPQVQVVTRTVEISQLQTAEKIVDDPDARIKFLAEEELCRVGDLVFDANGNLVANELRRRDCVMGEMKKNKPPFRLALNRAASDEIAQHCKHCTERGVMKLHGSGTALAEGMRVPVSKMEELTAAHCQASLKTVKNPDREPYPAYPSGKSWCEACGKTGSGKKFHHNVMSGVDFAAEAQQQHKSSKHQPTKQTMQQRERKEEKGQGEDDRRGEKGREENGRKSEEKRVRKEDEEGDSKVVKDVTDWTVVTRNKRQRKMAQIFVKVNGSKATPMEVNLTDDKVEDVMRQIQKDEDVYVTMHGKVLRKDEKLKSCEVTDGCTMQVTSRLRGGGKHKDKRSKADTKQGTEESGQKDQEVGSMSDKCQEMTKDQKDALIQTIERNEGYRRLITTNSEAEDWECRIQRFGKQLQEKSEIGEERAKVMEWGMRWAVEARKRRRDEEQEQSMGQEEDKKAESTDELKMMSRSEEVRTGRGSACLVQRTDEKCPTNKICRKGKGKGNGGKGEHGRKGGEGNKGAMHFENSVMDEDQENMRATTSEENHEEDVRKLLEMVEREEMELEMMQQEEMEHEEQRGRVAPNMGAGGSHPQATSDPRKKNKETRVLRWADCNDEEGKENEEKVEEEKEAGQWEMTEKRPPGLEEVESKQEAKKEQET